VTRLARRLLVTPRRKSIDTVLIFGEVLPITAISRAALDELV
jgi:hypothetical protein